MSEQADDGAPPADKVLLTFGEHGLVPGTPATLEDSDRSWLVYQPETEPAYIQLPLSPENVIFTDQQDLKELYKEMIDHLHQHNSNLRPEPLLNEMWDREKEYTSLLGHGIVLPHVWTDQVEQPILMVARARRQATCSLTHSTIELVFMLISPAGKPDEHLRNLAHIARLLGKNAKRADLLQAASAEELYQTIVSP